MRPGTTRLIVSVPNAFSLTGLFSLARAKEWVHPDHNVYFSRTTLRTLLAKSGLCVLEEFVYVFDVDYLPARRLRDTRFFDGRGAVESRRVLSSGRRMLGRLRRRRLAEMPAEIGRTLLSALLYRRTPYWGDGLVAVCTRNDDSGAAR
jgi:hypothetical protein